MVRRTGVVTDAVPMLRLRMRCTPGGNGGFVRPKCNTPSELPRPLSSSSIMCTGVAEYVEYDKCLCGVLFGVAADDGVIELDVVVFVVSPIGSSSSHERSSERVLRNDLRNLSTKRVWNLFRLLWLPAVGFGGLQPVLVLVGLLNELCDVRDDVRENGRELVRLIGTEWPRWAGDAA